MPIADEQDLLARCKVGDQSAYRILVEHHMRKVYNIAYSFLQNHDDADDVAQESFIRAHRALPAFRGEAGFSTWLYRIVTNLALDRLRQRQRTMERKISLEDPFLRAVAEHSNDMSEPDLQMHIERALHELPTLQRAVVILRHMDGFSTRQVSAILKCSEGTVKTHLHRGLKRMRSILRVVKEDQ